MPLLHQRRAKTFRNKRSPTKCLRSGVQLSWREAHRRLKGPQNIAMMQSSGARQGDDLAGLAGRSGPARVYRRMKHVSRVATGKAAGRSSRGGGLKAFTWGTVRDRSYRPD